MVSADMCPLKKLVRDRIPEVLERRGVRFRVYRVSGEEFLRYLLEKLREEVTELCERPSVEEVADVLEVLETLVQVLGYRWEEVLEVKEWKRRERGGFSGTVVEILDETTS